MKIGLECFECIVKQMFSTVRATTGDRNEQNNMIINLLRFMADTSHILTPPDMAAALRREEVALLGPNDKYRLEKDKSTDIGLALLPELRTIVANHVSPFEAALRLSIGGNIIDFGADPNFNLDTAESRIKEVFDLPIDEHAMHKLHRAMDEAKSIFFMLDNCGEAVIDRLLLEQFAHKITVGVRGFPILNDVTRREAAMSGIDFVPIIDTEDMTPGVSLQNTSKAFLEKMRSADLVITKGQGNYETLAFQYDRPIAFLLRVKCPVIAELLNQDMYSLQVQLKNF